MHVCVVGLGALGAVYGGLLLAHGRAEVSYLVRRPRVEPKVQIWLESAEGYDQFKVTPTHVGTEFADAAIDLILLTVHRDNMTNELLERVAAANKPVLTLTPFFPEDLARARGIVTTGLTAAVAGVISYENQVGAFRYWLPKLSPTLVEADPEPPAVVTQLVAEWQRVGIPVALRAGVERSSPAMSASFIPLMGALEVAGGLRQLVADPEILQLGCRAQQEGRALAERLGELPEPMGTVTAKLSPRVLSLVSSALGVVEPEMVRYLDHHFGHKLIGQNLNVVRYMRDRAQQEGLPNAALTTLAERLTPTSR